jgi:hypothetical protein
MQNENEKKEKEKEMQRKKKSSQRHSETIQVYLIFQNSRNNYYRCNKILFSTNLLPNINNDLTHSWMI